MGKLSKYNEFINENIEEFYTISIELVDFKGREFDLVAAGTKFTQDEIEMIIEDFEVVAKIHNLRLFQEEGQDLEYDIEDYDPSYSSYEFDIWPDWVDIHIFINNEILDEALPDLNNFVNGISNNFKCELKYRKGKENDIKIRIYKI